MLIDVVVDLLGSIEAYRAQVQDAYKNMKLKQVWMDILALLLSWSRVSLTSESLFWVRGNTLLFVRRHTQQTSSRSHRSHGAKVGTSSASSPLVHLIKRHRTTHNYECDIVWRTVTNTSDCLITELTETLCTTSVANKVMEPD